MSTFHTERFNFGFVLLSLVILSSLSAGTNFTATKIPDSSEETKPTEELTVDKQNSISTISRRDNSLDGYPSVTTRAQIDLEVTITQAETEADNLSTTETNRNFEVSHNASIEPKSITTPETRHQYTSLAVSETTVVHAEDDQTTTANTDVEASWSAKVNTTSETVQNNSIRHQENINFQFAGNSLSDASYNSTENKTAITDSRNTKPTKETIMGVGIKTTVSVSLKVQDANISGTNLTDAEKSAINTSCKSSVTKNSTDITNKACLEAIENITVSDNTNETVHTNNIIQTPDDEPPALNSTTKVDQKDSTEISPNDTSTNGSEVESTSQQTNSSEIYSNNKTELNSNVNDSSTESDSNAGNDSNSTQLNPNETNLSQNVTETTSFEESSNSTEASTMEHKIPDTSLPANNSTEAHFETSTSQTIVPNNETSEQVTHTKTHSPISSTTNVETENATEAELTTTPQPIIRFAGVMKIVHGLNWSEELTNRQSIGYKKAARRMTSLLEDVFSSTMLAGILKEVEIDGFSEGSVIVDYFLTLVESDNLHPEYLLHVFNSHFARNHTYRNFTIDPLSTEFQVVKESAVEPTTESRVEPPVPQWVVAVVVIAAASLVFIILFAAVTIYGRHYGRRSYNKKLQGDEIIFDKPDYQSGPRLSDAAYENLAADAVYDVESSPEKSEGMANSMDNQFDSWRTNRLTRMPSSKRFSFNSS